MSLSRHTAQVNLYLVEKNEKFLSLFLLARYIRFCKLDTCRLTLFHLMEFQSVVFGFAGSQTLTFGVKLIICHQLFKLYILCLLFYKITLYTSMLFTIQNSARVSPPKHKFIIWFWYLSIVIKYCSIIFFPMGLSTVDSFSFPLKSHIPYRISFRSHSTYHKKSCGL